MSQFINILGLSKSYTSSAYRFFLDSGFKNLHHRKESNYYKIINKKKNGSRGRTI